MLIPIILSGGAGTRLWPVSCEAFPIANGVQCTQLLEPAGRNTAPAIALAAPPEAHAESQGAVQTGVL